MSIAFREATPDDRDAILALRRRCFGDTDPEKLDRRFWDWEFSRARMFVGERDGAIVTHVAIVPWGEVPLAVDAMTAPEARGSGAYSGVMAFALERAGDRVMHAFQIRDAVLGAMLRNGWRVEESIPVMVRPASLRRLAGWKPLRLRSGQAPERPAGSRRSIDADEMASVARTKEFIQWRFFENPLWAYDIRGEWAGGKLVAWIVTRRVTLKNYDTLAIVDIAGPAKNLIKEAVADAKNMGCELVAAFVSRAHPARSLLLRQFFVPGPHRFRLLVHGDGTTKPVTWADTDHL